MKQIGFLAVALFGVVQLASAAPACVSGSLASYIALGSGGCMIGTNILSQFTESSFLAGATAIAPGSLTVTPIGGTTNPGITVTGTITANTGQTFDALLNYTIAGNTFTSDTLTLANTSATGNGAVTDIQNFCQNGNFTPPAFVGGCPAGMGPGSPLVVLGNGSAQANLSAFSVGVTHNFTVDSGGTGTASGISVTDQYAAIAGTPEPATYVLTALGLALAVGRKLRTNLKGNFKK